MTLQEILNSVGLFLDITGAIILLKFGIPNNISLRGERHLLLEGEDKEEISKANKYKVLEKMGLTLIIVGFSLQLLSNFPLFKK